MWSFIAHIQYYNEADNKEEIEIIAFNAPGFVEATQIIAEHYGNSLMAILKLEPISDLPIMYINSDIEHSIRSIEENSWS